MYTYTTNQTHRIVVLRRSLTRLALATVLALTALLAARPLPAQAQTTA